MGPTSSDVTLSPQNPDNIPESGIRIYQNGTTGNEQLRNLFDFGNNLNDLTYLAISISRSRISEIHFHYWMKRIFTRTIVSIDLFRRHRKYVLFEPHWLVIHEVGHFIIAEAVFLAKLTWSNVTAVRSGNDKK